MAHSVRFGRRPRTAAARRRETLEVLTASGAVPMLSVYDLVHGSQVGRRFNEIVTEMGQHELGGDSWPCEKERLGDLKNVVFRDGNSVVIQDGGTVALVVLAYGWLNISVAAPAQSSVAAMCSSFRSAFPASYMTVDSELRVPITFWTNSPHGPVPRLRKIDSAAWDEVTGNYTAPVKTQLEELMSWDAGPPRDGQLLLWQGPPGTGKTWALRALATRWSSWAEFHYITDPDSFFVRDPSYMVSVLLADSYDVIEPTSGDVYSENDPLGKWRVLILEDTGELLAANAKDNYGQGLSRLLNVVDGMIGQGLRVLAIVTTNDELGDLHPAVSRPGRCASQIEFAPLTATEASEWLGSPVEEGGTLAELYSRTHAGTAPFAAAEPLVASGDHDLAGLIRFASQPLPPLEPGDLARYGHKEPS